MICQQCHHPPVHNPISPVLMGHLNAQPIYRQLCAVCAANHNRRYTSRGVKSPEMKEK